MADPDEGPDPVDDVASDDDTPWDPVRDVEQAAAFDQGSGAATTGALVVGLALAAAAGVGRMLRRRRRRAG